MIIISNNRKIIVNFDNVVELFTMENTIKANTVNGGRTVVETYHTKQETETAFQMLRDAVGTYERFVMPDEKQLQAYTVRTHDTAPRNITGKKSKGHGGS